MSNSALLSTEAGRVQGGGGEESVFAICWLLSEFCLCSPQHSRIELSDWWFGKLSGQILRHRIVFCSFRVIRRLTWPDQPLKTKQNRNWQCRLLVSHLGSNICLGMFFHVDALAEEYENVWYVWELPSFCETNTVVQIKEKAGLSFTCLYRFLWVFF